MTPCEFTGEIPRIFVLHTNNEVFLSNNGLAHYNKYQFTHHSSQNDQKKEESKYRFLNLTPSPRDRKQIITKTQTLIWKLKYRVKFTEMNT